MLDQCQRFKAEFLAKCAEAGLTAEETREVVKQAAAVVIDREKRAGLNDWLKGNIPGYALMGDLARGAVQGGVPKLMGLGAGAAVGIPLAVGGAVGLGAAQMGNFNDADPEELKTNEKIQEYRLAAQRAQMQDAIRRLREQNRPRRPML